MDAGVRRVQRTGADSGRNQTPLWQVTRYVSSASILPDCDVHLLYQTRDDVNARDYRFSNEVMERKLAIGMHSGWFQSNS
jgi:hypothetical protein